MDILERIRKLHALASRNESTHEATAAAEKAQELCFQHNLDLEAVLASGGGERAPYVQADYVMKATRNDTGWKRSLFGGICKANFCSAIMYSGTSKMGVVGQKHNFDVVVYLFEYLTGEIERLAVRSCISEGIITKRSQYMRQFCEGASASVYWRLKAQHKTTAEATGESRELVVVQDRELGKAVRQFWPRLRTTHRRISAGNGYGQGNAVGKSMPINRGVGGGSRTLIR